jgi:phosphoketolase
MANPRIDSRAADLFNEGARRLWVTPADLAGAVALFQQHETSGRVRERDHGLAHRDVPTAKIPHPPFRPVSDETRGAGETWTTASPMTAIDRMFVAILEANPDLRPRVGNPDEMLSNRLVATLGRLKFRVTDPEPAVPESVEGAVITALNEEAVVSAALANKGGINLAHTYEAFGSKMHGAVRQEIIFANHCLEAGRPQRWLSMPLILTSHTWENGKNEQSHQDPSMAEAMLGEPSHVSRVLFPPDFNGATAVMEQIYRTHGQIWTLVVPKADIIPDLFTPEEARRLVKDGGLRLEWAGHQREQARLILVAVGAYQLMEVLRASRRLAERPIAHAVVYLLEPGRFRAPRSIAEQAHQASPDVIARLFPAKVAPRLFVTHTRPETILGLLGSLHTGSATVGLGYTNHGGTLSTQGLVFVNQCSWAHCLRAAARLLQMSDAELLSEDERRALDGKLSPHGVIIPHVLE